MIIRKLNDNCIFTIENGEDVKKLNKFIEEVKKT